MIAKATARMEIDSEEALNRVRETITAALADSNEAVAIAFSATRESQLFEVTCVNINTKEVTTETIVAMSEYEAKAQVETADKVVSGISTNA